MYIYKNIACLYNNEQTDDQNSNYKNFINTYIPNYTFDTSFPNNQTIFVLNNNVITSVFKLDMYLNIICLTNIYVNNDYYTTVDDANKTYQQIIDVIITNIVTTLQSSNLTYNVANMIKFKIYLYVNYDLDKSLYNKTKRTNCINTILGGHIPNICNEFVRFLHFNDQFIAKNVILHTSSETQTDKQSQSITQPITTNFNSTFSQPTPQPTNFNSTFSQSKPLQQPQPTTNFSSAFSQPTQPQPTQPQPTQPQPTQPQPTNFSSVFNKPQTTFGSGFTQPQNAFNSSFGKDLNKEGEKGNGFTGFTQQSNQFGAFTSPLNNSGNNMFNGVFGANKDNKFGNHR